VALRDHNGDGKYDRVDPLLDFTLQATWQPGSGVVLTWAAMPGRSYQLEHATQPGGLWSDLAGASHLAGPLQLFLSHTNVPPAGESSKFFRAKLVN
jgi:hypothetical protein